MTTGLHDREHRRGRLAGLTYAQLMTEASKLVDSEARLRNRVVELEAELERVTVVRRLVPVVYQLAYYELEDLMLHGASPGEQARYRKRPESRPPKHNLAAYEQVTKEERFFSSTCLVRATAIRNQVSRAQKATA